MKVPPDRQAKMQRIVFGRVSVSLM